jgi:hypothetical protein
MMGIKAHTFFFDSVPDARPECEGRPSSGDLPGPVLLPAGSDMR